MFASWFILAIIAGLFSTLFNTINRKHLKVNSDSTAYSWWFEALKALVFLIFSWFNFRLEFSVINVGILVLLGISEFVAVYFFMKMHTHIELSVSSVVTQFRVILVPLMAFFIIGERLAINAYIGIVLLLCGLLLTVSKLELVKIKKGVQYAILFSVVSSFSSILTKQASGFASVPVVMFAFAFPSVILFPLLMKNSTQRILVFAQKHSRTITTAVAANIVTLLLLGTAYTVGTVSQISAIFFSMFIGNILVGTLFLGERFTFRQVFGVSIVLVSIFMIH